MREIILCKWRLAYKKRYAETLKEKEWRSDVFVIDRVDDKRRSGYELKEILFKLSGIYELEEEKKYTIRGTDDFKGYALSYHCKP
jgi:hypothetical protein